VAILVPNYRSLNINSLHAQSTRIYLIRDFALADVPKFSNTASTKLTSDHQVQLAKCTSCRFYIGEELRWRIVSFSIEVDFESFHNGLEQCLIRTPGAFELGGPSATETTGEEARLIPQRSYRFV